MTNIINLTPHSLQIKGVDGSITTIAPSGTLARVAATSQQTDEINGIAVYSTVYGEVEGLPAPAENTVYVVASLVAARCQGRDDVLVPGAPIRDEEGKIIGANGLQRI